MKRTRPDSTLEALSAEQKQILSGWLLSPDLNHFKILKMLSEQFQVESSSQALSRFYRAYCIPEILRRRSEAVSMANEIAQEMERAPAKWDEVLMEVLMRKSVALAMSDESTPTQVKQLVSLVLKSRDQELAERKLAKKEEAEATQPPPAHLIPDNPG